ncbi:M24 family metallopeptidase [Vulcanisaeta thermophila]|uniref:M24 family metallopeptidase n=1 Tax=Vulcanisaeta thermophila TaxID=867917 RepID=UPI0009FC2541|nr:Xaa-Pro peptidase family protein [Vulcanisaeta thermophila]
MGGKIKGLMEALKDLDVDAVVVVPGANFRYLVGMYIETFERFGALIICVKTNDYALVLPRLDEGKARSTGLPYVTYGDGEDPAMVVRGFLSGCGPVRRVGVEGGMRVSQLWVLRRAVGDFVDVPIDGVVMGMRISKDEEEIRNIEGAVRALERGFRAVEEELRPGITERELARIVASEIEAHGAEPRDILIQSGPNSAIPHWLPGNRRIERGDVVVVDITATHNDYYGDLTRTFTVGDNEPSGFRVVYDLVKRAHDEAIGNVRDGVTGSYLDSIARGVITRGGFGEYFIHRTGHGIGLEVHEEPFISQDYDKPLPRGSVFTIEPGIYIPGRFGVRIESNVVINRDGSVLVLDKYPY